MSVSISSSKTDLSAPLLTNVFSPFAPSRTDRDFNINDFPAPVSPVITVRPSLNETSNSSRIAKSFTLNLLIIVFPIY